jgi:DNA replication protein DnaC
MLNQQTINKLHELKLAGMAEAFADQLNQPDMDRLSFAERLGLIVDRQWTWKENNRMERYLKNARMKLDACVEDIDYKTPRGIDQSVMMSLIACDWVKRHHNIIITGPTGAGKTFLACALTNKACREGYRAFYIRSSKFSYQMALAKGDGSYGKTINKLAKAHVLVIDDLGLTPMTDAERRDLLEVVEERYGHASTIVTSQLPVEHWHEQIGDPTIADAILDRLVHNAHKINLSMKGDSLRKKYAGLT